ncbi:unnamed protein product [Tenebrio molitor]|nr:unnamed protein product [Tenebrio molitor]
MASKIILHVFLLSLLFIFIPYNQNNSCASYLGYLFPSFSNDCYHNPDVDNNITNIIQRHATSPETHQVQTQDGFILSLFRIPRENPRGVILFQHCYLCDARIWVTQHNESIAFLFWRAGYDVWLGNSRGNFYSKRHATLSPSDGEFWNYSFFELGYYDVHASVEYIKATTNHSKIIFMGYSLGGSAGLVYSSMRPEDATKSLRIIVSIAAATHFRYAFGPMEFVTSFIFKMQSFNNHTGIYSIGRYDSWGLKFFRISHRLFPFKKYLPYAISFFFGWTPDEMDPSYSNLMISQFGSESSLNIIYHGYQQRLLGIFQAYDYGEIKNMRLYGSTNPLLYPLEKIKVPVFLVYSYDDWFCHYKDNELVHNRLPEEAKIYGKLAVKGINHVDFAYGKRRNQEVYNKILKVLNSLPKTFD